MARVLIIADTHCPCMQMKPSYIDFLKDIHHQWSCNRVVHIGDVCNWNAISYHDKNPAHPGAAEEFERAKEQVRMIQDAFPVLDVMTGNHDALPERKARDVGLDPEIFLRDYATIWETPKWTWHPRYANLIIDDCIYMHGDKGRGGSFPAIKKAIDNFASVICGHYHTEGGCMYFATERDRVFGLQVSTGCDSKGAMEYGVKFARRPLIGCGVVIDGREAYYEIMPLKCKRK